MQPSLQAPSGMVGHAADRLCAAVSRVAAPICVGLDPVLERLPEDLASSVGDEASAVTAIESFCLGVLDAMAGHAGVVKFQSACFERYGAAGLAVLERSIRSAMERELVTILDAKRGDIGISATHYAAAGRRLGGDWITVNGWLGEDGVEPFLQDGGGAFVLVRTSNPTSEQMQRLRLEDGRTVSEAMADLVDSMAGAHVGACGYSTLGAVVGATHPGELAGFRERLSRVILLLPGYGAQGGTAESIAPCFDAEGLGAIVTASRSIIYAFHEQAGDWTGHVRSAIERFAEEIGSVAGMRS